MDAKLISLLIHSNATLIEAIGEHARQTSENYSENNFWNLRQECIALAEQAEAMIEKVEPVTVSTSIIEPEEGLTRLMVEELTETVITNPKSLHGRRLLLKQEDGANMFCSIQHSIFENSIHGGAVRFQLHVYAQGDRHCDYRTVRTIDELKKDFIKWL